MMYTTVKSPTRRARIPVHLTDLPDDVLYLLFTYCDLRSLGRLSSVCKALHKFINADCIWLPHSKRLVLINGLDPYSRNCYPSLKERCHIARNWSKGISREVTLIRHQKKQLPWMQYDYINHTLWISACRNIFCYKVLPSGYLQEDKHRRLSGLLDDVTRFVVKNSVTVSGCGDGSIYGWHNDTGRKLFQYEYLHNHNAQCVDFYGNFLVSGSKDTTVKILTMGENQNNNRIQTTLQVGDRVWSIAIAPDGSTFASGSAGCNGSYPLILWNPSSGTQLLHLGTNEKRGAGILDLKYESPHTLLACGYDAFVRLWDVRTGNCVLKWEEPFDSAIYCLQTDRDQIVVTGTARYGMTRMWDKRRTHPVQLYFVGHRNSPVYSLAFDSAHLYVALDLSVNMLDFSVH